MPSITRHDTGPRMSQMVVCGDMIYTAGQVSQNAAGASVAEQTKDILARIDELLATAGSDKTKIVTATIWLADISSFAEMNSIWDAWVPQGHTPARACVESKLAAPQYTVEIQVTAAR